MRPDSESSNPQPTMPLTGNAQRDAPIAMGAEEFRKHGHALVDSIAEFMDSLPDRPVTQSASPDEIRALLDADRTLPETGMDAGTLLRSATDLLYSNSLFNGHPRFFGYITSPPAPRGHASSTSTPRSPMSMRCPGSSCGWVVRWMRYSAMRELCSYNPTRWPPSHCR